MNKLLLSLLILLIISGCSKGHDEVVVSNNNPIAEEIVGIYDANNQENESTTNADEAESEIIPRNYQYISSPDVMVTLNWDFFIEGNPCIFDDHIVATVGVINYADNMLSLEVGSNCYDHSRQGPAVNIGISDIPIKDDVELNVHDNINIYYEFPEGFVPESYLDYLNYATLIEKQ